MLPSCSWSSAASSARSDCSVMGTWKNDIQIDAEAVKTYAGEGVDIQAEIVDMCLNLLRHRFKSYGIEVDLKRDKPLPAVLVDPDQLKEVFVNILVNACEAMADGGAIAIEEKVERADPIGTVAVVKIRDTGPGIPEADRDRVFTAFAHFAEARKIISGQTFEVIGLPDPKTARSGIIRFRITRMVC